MLNTSNIPSSSKAFMPAFAAGSSSKKSDIAIRYAIAAKIDDRLRDNLGDFAGWFNLLGQVAVTAAIVYTLANHLAAMIVLGTGGAGTGGRIITQEQLLGIYAGKTQQRVQH